MFMHRARYKICYIPKICQYIPFGLASLFQFEAVKDSLNLELPSTLLCKNMGLVGVRLTIFTLINFVAKSNYDRRRIEWRSCNEVMCSFTEYQVDAGEKLCSYCGHVPVLHTDLTVLKKLSNIIDYPRQENNSLEKTLNVL
ncbi:hypothetical protein Avbf_16744 [Armadillidium vulgare]|nr:hypothetical protein Avbf_16744 [Armadillidium vulgare]